MVLSVTNIIQVKDQVRYKTIYSYYCRLNIDIMFDVRDYLYDNLRLRFDISQNLINL